MREKEFERFLVKDNQIESKDKAVRSRVSKARKIEVEFKVNLDDIVRDDERMFTTLLEISSADRVLSNFSISFIAPVAALSPSSAWFFSLTLFAAVSAVSLAENVADNTIKPANTKIVDR